jgi:radical SAM protein with 4Fe4S-binding SPASM domain
MKLNKEKILPIKDEIALKISGALFEINKDQLGLRKILFKFLKENLKYVEEVDSFAYRILREKYEEDEADLTSVGLADLTQEVIIWKEAKKEVCKDCIIIVNCSKNCEKLKERYNNLHQKHSKELWNGQKGKV